MQIQKAQRKKVKLKIGVTAPSGYGKTTSALYLAKGISGDYAKVCILDTENGSGSINSHLGEYSVVELSAPFTPERYIEAIKMVEQAGFECLIIDSISHEWEGKGGCLEINEQLGGRYQDWAKVTPRHRAFIDAILQCNMHVITTARRKQDYEMTKDSNGRLKVEKVGLKEVTREGFEYELTINFEIQSPRHLANVGKDRTGIFDGKPEFIITEDIGRQILEWANSGVEEEKRDIKKEIDACETLEQLANLWKYLSTEQKKEFNDLKEAKKNELNNSNSF